jgi:hypothetical protein
MAAKAEANAIATAAATAVAATIATPRDGCVGGSAVAATQKATGSTTTRHDDGNGRHGQWAQGDRRHDNGDGQHDDGDGRHDDGRHDRRRQGAAE